VIILQYSLIPNSIDYIGALSAKHRRKLLPGDNETDGNQDTTVLQCKYKQNIADTKGARHYDHCGEVTLTGVLLPEGTVFLRELSRNDSVLPK
jgi:hypothetical protein